MVVAAVAQAAKSIFNLIQNIKEKVDEVKANGERCQTLAMRIKLLEEPMQSALNWKEARARRSLPTLHELLKCLNKCDELITFFGSNRFLDKYVWRIVWSAAYSKQFEELNKALDRLGDSLQLQMLAGFMLDQDRHNRDLAADLQKAKGVILAHLMKSKGRDGKASEVKEAHSLLRSVNKEILLSSKRADKSYDRARTYVRLPGIIHKVAIAAAASSKAWRLDAERIVPSPSQWSEIKEQQLVIGQGGFGTVYRAEMDGTIVVAVKIIETTKVKPTLARELIKEARGLYSLRHANIVLCLGAVEEPLREQCMVMEFCAEGALFDAIQHGTRTMLPRERVVRWALEIAAGMQYLHKEGVTHRDLKSLNVLLNEGLVCKICDFGLSKGLSDRLSTRGRTAIATATGAVGTFNYMAPEVMEGGDGGKSSDVYAYGMLLFEMVTRSIPWENVNIIKMGQQVAKGVRPVLPDSASWLGGLIERCWAQTPAHRPTFGAVLQMLDSIREGKAVEPRQPTRLNETVAAAGAKATAKAPARPESKRRFSLRFGSLRRASQVSTSGVWVPDAERSSCNACAASFSVFRRRHHCRRCGEIFCHACVSNTMLLEGFPSDAKQSVCEKCFLIEHRSIASAEVKNMYSEAQELFSHGKKASAASVLAAQLKKSKRLAASLSEHIKMLDMEAKAHKAADELKVALTTLANAKWLQLEVTIAEAAADVEQKRTVMKKALSEAQSMPGALTVELMVAVRTMLASDDIAGTGEGAEVDGLNFRARAMGRGKEGGSAVRVLSAQLKKANEVAASLRAHTEKLQMELELRAGDDELKLALRTLEKAKWTQIQMAIDEASKHAFEKHAAIKRTLKKAQAVPGVLAELAAEARADLDSVDFKARHQELERAEGRMRAKLAEFKQASDRNAAAIRGGGVELGRAFNEKKAAVAAVAREVAGMVGLDAALLAQARAVAETPDAVWWDASRKGWHITVQEGGAKAARTSEGRGWSNKCGVVGSAGWSRGTHSWSVEAYTPKLCSGRFSSSVVGVATGKLTGSELQGGSCDHVQGKTFGHQLCGGHTKYSLGKVSGSDFQVRKQRVTLRLTLDCDAHTLEVVDDGGQSLKIKLPAGETFFPYAAQYHKSSWVKFVSN